MDQSVFQFFDASRSHRLARRASLLKNLLHSEALFSKAFYAYCRNEIMDVPEYLADCAEFEYRYQLGVAKYSDITSSAPSHSVSSVSCDDALFWADHGFLYKPGYFSADVCDALLGFLREDVRIDGVFRYSHVPSLMDVYCSTELHRLLRLVTAVEPVLYMSLHDLKTTSRSWHQDEFLAANNSVGSSFAVWIALDDICFDMGPFCFLPGSHKWPVLDRSKLLNYFDGGSSSSVLRSPEWVLPPGAAAVTVPAYELKLAESRVAPLTYLPRRGDLLIWHSRLLHRAKGSTSPDLKRPGVIAHYCSMAEISPSDRALLKRHGDMWFAEDA